MNTIVSDEFDRVMAAAGEETGIDNFGEEVQPQQPSAPPASVPSEAPAATAAPAAAFDMDAIRSAISFSALPEETQKAVAAGEAELPEVPPMSKIDVVKSLATDIFRSSKSSFLAAGLFALLSLPFTNQLLTGSLSRFSIDADSSYMLVIKVMIFLVALIAAVRIFK